MRCAGGGGADPFRRGRRRGGGGLGLVAEGFGELGIVVLGEVGAQFGGRGRVLRVPDEGLAKGFHGVGVGGVTLEVAAALGAGFGVIGEDAAEAIW